MAKPVRVGQDGKVAIPAQVRKDLGWVPGTDLVVVPDGRTLRLVPKVDVRTLRGIARGADTSGFRDRRPED